MRDDGAEHEVRDGLVRGGGSRLDDLLLASAGPNVDAGLASGAGSSRCSQLLAPSYVLVHPLYAHALPIGNSRAVVMNDALPIAKADLANQMQLLKTAMDEQAVRDQAISAGVDIAAAVEGYRAAKQGTIYFNNYSPASLLEMSRYPRPASRWSNLFPPKSARGSQEGDPWSRIVATADPASSASSPGAASIEKFGLSPSSRLLGSGAAWRAVQKTTSSTYGINSPTRRVRRCSNSVGLHPPGYDRGEPEQLRRNAPRRPQKSSVGRCGLQFGALIEGS